MNSTIYKNDPFELCRSYDCTPKGNDLMLKNDDLRIKSGVYLLDNALNHMKKIVKDNKTLQLDETNQQTEYTNQTANNFLQSNVEGFEDIQSDKLKSKISFEREIQLQPDVIQQQQMYPYKFQRQFSPNNFMTPQMEQSRQQSNLGAFRTFAQQQGYIPAQDRDRRRIYQANPKPSAENPFSVEQRARYRPARFPNFLDEAPNYIQPSQMIRQSRRGTLQNPPLPSQWNPLADDSAIYKGQFRNDILKTIQYDRTNDATFLRDKQIKGNWISPVAGQLSNLESSPTDLANLSINPVSQTFNQKQRQTAQKIQQKLSSEAPRFTSRRMNATPPNTSLPATSIENFEEFPSSNASLNSSGDILSVETRCEYQKAKVIHNKNGNPNLAYHSYMDLPASTFVPPKKEDTCLQKFDEYAKDSDLILKDRSLRRKAGMDNLNREMCLLDFENVYAPHIPF